MNFENNEIYLVDYFDTCVSRTVHPEYIKYLWSSIIKIFLGLDLSSDEVYKIRNKLELNLCNSNKENGLDDEFSFTNLSNEFYSYVNSNIKDISGLYSRNEFQKFSSDTELELELKYQYLLNETISLIRNKRDLGCKIILVSDFYLGKDEFEKLLAHHKIRNLFDHIYISSEYFLTKRSGRLYDLILEECSIDPSSTTMIGDNPYSDFENAKLKGFKTNFLDVSQKKKEDEELFKRDTSINEIHKKIWNEVNQSLNKSQNLFFPNISLTLYSFIRKLYTKLRQNNVQNVFFFSREGEFLKKLFDLYQSKLTSNPAIKTHYFLASRKSTFLPSLSELENENFEMLFRQYVNISPKDFLLSLNFEEKWINNFANSISKDLSIIETHLPTSKIFSEIISNQKFKAEYERRRLQQRNNFLEYLDSFGVDLENDTFSFVDIGWKGTMQDNIRKILPKSTKIHGYYLGLLTHQNISPDNQKEGIIFSPPPHSPYGSWIFSNTTALYEILLGASHGSASEYIKNKEGSIEVKLNSHPYETNLYQEQISPLLNKYFEIFSSLCDVFNSTHLDIEHFDKMISQFHASMVLMPKKDEVSFIEAVNHYENFGVFKFTEFKGKKVSTIKRIQNLVSLIKSPHETLSQTMWPAVTFKKLGLPLLQYGYGWYLYKMAFDEGESRTYKIVRKLLRHG